MNTELVRANQEKVIIPTSYRIDYLGALKALSHNQNFTPLIRMLDYAQRYTSAIEWEVFQDAHKMLIATGAFEEGEYARLVLP